MPPQLNDFQKGLIIAKSEDGWSLQQIADHPEIQKNKSTICRFLKHYNESGDYKRKKGSGRKRCTTERQDRAIIRATKKQRLMVEHFLGQKRFEFK